MPNQVVEAEIIEQPEGFSYKERYSESYNKTRQASGLVWALTILSLFFSIIPIFGFMYAWFAFFVNIIKKVPPIIPIIALIISGFITSLFVLFVWILKAIF